MNIYICIYIYIYIGAGRKTTSFSRSNNKIRSITKRKTIVEMVKQMKKNIIMKNKLNMNMGERNAVISRTSEDIIDFRENIEKVLFGERISKILYIIRLNLQVFTPLVWIICWVITILGTVKVLPPWTTLFSLLSLPFILLNLVLPLNIKLFWYLLEHFEVWYIIIYLMIVWTGMGYLLSEDIGVIAAFAGFLNMLPTGNSFISL